MTTITLYYSPGACSFASHIALEEAGLAYATRRISTATGEQRSPEYLKVNPRGRVPALVVDGQVLVENVAILVWIAGGHPEAGLWPKTTWEQVQALSLLTWFADTVHPAFRQLLRPERYVHDPALFEAVKAKGREDFTDGLREIDRMLAGKTWILGKRFSVVDGYLLVFYRWGNRNGIAVRDLPNLTRHAERMLARPAVKRVMADEGITLG